MNLVAEMMVVRVRRSRMNAQPARNHLTILEVEQAELLDHGHDEHPGQAPDANTHADIEGVEQEQGNQGSSAEQAHDGDPGEQSEAGGGEVVLVTAPRPVGQQDGCDLGLHRDGEVPDGSSSGLERTEHLGGDGDRGGLDGVQVGDVDLAVAHVLQGIADLVEGVGALLDGDGEGLRLGLASLDVGEADLGDGEVGRDVSDGGPGGAGGADSGDGHGGTSCV